MAILTRRTKYIRRYTMEGTVVAVFREQRSAEQAVRDMREQGFGDDEISIIAKDERRRGGGGEMSYENQNLADGTTTGGALGGLAGLLAGAGALLIPGIGPIIAAGPLAGALTGVVTGGVAGGLIDYGIPEERGQHYEDRVREGKVLVTVRSEEEETQSAMDILKENGAEEVEIH
jgi:hypothetical protein